MIEEIKMNILLYVKTLIVGMTTYMLTPEFSIADTLQQNTTLTADRIDLLNKIVNSLFSILTTCTSVFFTLFITWRFDKWKKKQK